MGLYRHYSLAACYERYSYQQPIFKKKKRQKPKTNKKTKQKQKQKKKTHTKKTKQSDPLQPPSPPPPPKKKKKKPSPTARNRRFPTIRLHRFPSNRVKTLRKSVFIYLLYRIGIKMFVGRKGLGQRLQIHCCRGMNQSFVFYTHPLLY